MTNPFDDATSPFLVLCNADRQYSLWPADLEVPAGWQTVHGPADRQGCAAHIDEHWNSLKPVTGQPA